MADCLCLKCRDILALISDMVGRPSQGAAGSDAAGAREEQKHVRRRSSRDHCVSRPAILAVSERSESLLGLAACCLLFAWSKCLFSQYYLTAADLFCFHGRCARNEDAKSFKFVHHPAVPTRNRGSGLLTCVSR